MGLVTVWDDEKVESLERCISEHMSAGQTALELRVTRNAVIGKAARIGLRFLSRPGALRIIRIPRNQHTCKTPKPRRIDAFPPESAPEAIGPLAAFPDTKSCRWIAGDPASRDWRCCGQPGFPYCEYHTAHSYQQDQPRKKYRVDVPPKPRNSFDEAA